MTNRVVNPILDRETEVGPTPYDRGEWSIVRCRETDFVFLANPPAYDRLEEEFAWEKTYEEEKARRRDVEPVLGRMSAAYKAARLAIFSKRNKIATLVCDELATIGGDGPRRVLDIGCGEGMLMVEIRERMAARGVEVEPFGVEVSIELAARSNALVEPHGGRVVCANAIDGTAELDPGSIHVAAMSSFLEHESRPLHLLQQLHRALAPGGRVVLKVPNFACWNRTVRGTRWCGFRYPDHVNYFTPQTLARLVEEAGFRITRQSLFDRFPLSDNMYAVLGKIDR